MTETLNGRYQLDADPDPEAVAGATCLLSGRRVQLGFAPAGDAPRGRPSRVLHPGLLEVLEVGSVEEGPPAVLRRGFWVVAEPPGPALAALLEAGEG
ncbi:MAG: hypothetical protein R3F62_29100, partial [Planctomycetota bacterium]